MNRRALVISTCACAVGLSTASRIVGQKKTIEPDLAELAEGKGLKVFKGLVGPWVGNNSGGDFANFKIVPA